MNIEEATNKLKPCPFCGRKDLSLIYLDEEGYQQQFRNGLTEYVCVECDTCKLMVREQVFSFEEDLESLVQKWNTRVEQ